MTQTPASGPLAPVTTPPMSSLSVRTAPPPACPAMTGRPDPTSNTAIPARPPTRISAADNLFFVLMSFSLSERDRQMRSLYTPGTHPGQASRPRARRISDILGGFERSCPGWAEQNRPTYVGRILLDPPHAGSERTRPTNEVPMAFTLTINGKSTTVDAAPDMPLLKALRDTLNMKGTKYSWA